MIVSGIFILICILHVPYFAIEAVYFVLSLAWAGEC